MYLFLNVLIWPIKLPVCLFLCQCTGDSEYLPISFSLGHHPLPLHVVNHVFCSQLAHERQGPTCATHSFLQLWSQGMAKTWHVTQAGSPAFSTGPNEEDWPWHFLLWVLGGSGIGAACTYLLSHVEEAHLHREGKTAHTEQGWGRRGKKKHQQ